MLSHPNIVKYYTCWFEESTAESILDESYIFSNEGTVNSEIYGCSVNRSTSSENSLSLFIQMEFCENKTLSEFLEKIKGPVGSFVAFKIFNDILKGLREIHEKNIIHRDLK